MTDWQLIETAPKDGTRVWLFGDVMWIGRGANDGFFNWHGYDLNGKPRNSNYKEPTHWMPIPAPPASLGERPQQEG